MPLVQTFDPSPVAGARWAKLPLLPLHATAWGETKATMIWAVPAYADIWLAMMCDKDHEMAWFTDRIDTAATDDKFLYINAPWFFKLSLDERLFVSCHEIAHAMYGHAGLFWSLHKRGEIVYLDGVSLPVEHELLNAAADYIINDQLVQAKIGVMPDKGLHWPEKITGDMSVIDAYRILWELKKGGGGRGKPCNQTSKPGRGGDSQSGESFDKVLKPGEGQGKSVNKAISERNEGEWNVAIQAAMESAKARGQLPANLDRLFTKRLNPQADWRDLYQLAVSKKIGNDRYTWDRLDQQLAYRHIGCPGRTSFGCELVIVARDSSGSINDKTCAVFGAETIALLEQAKPRRVIIVDCDSAIHRWDDIGDDLGALEDNVKGGGGTAFEPVFERIESEGLEPDLLVYLTDLDGSFPSKPPRYPVVWGSIDKNKHAPWGEEVWVPEQADA